MMSDCGCDLCGGCSYDCCYCCSSDEDCCCEGCRPVRGMTQPAAQQTVQPPAQPQPVAPVTITLPIAFHLLDLPMVMNASLEVIYLENFKCDQLTSDILEETNRIWKQADIQFVSVLCERLDMYLTDEQRDAVFILETCDADGSFGDGADARYMAIQDLTMYTGLPLPPNVINVYVMPSIGEGKVGMTTRFSKEGENDNFFGTVTLATTTDYYGAVVPDNPKTGRVITPREIGLILAHELGHILDIDHNGGECEACLMGPVVGLDNEDFNQSQIDLAKQTAKRFKGVIERAQTRSGGRSAPPKRMVRPASDEERFQFDY